MFKNIKSNQTKLMLVFIALVLTGVIGFFFPERLVFHYASIHIGGIGVIGLLAILIGFIGKRKGYNFLQAIIITIVFPVAIGIASTGVKYLQSQGEVLECSAPGIIGVLLVIAVVYGLLKRKSRPEGA